jgi:hypothetical protein
MSDGVEWNKILESQPVDSWEVVLFSNGVIQNVSYFFVERDTGGFWYSSHEDIDELIAVKEGDQWVYIADIPAPTQ